MEQKSWFKEHADTIAILGMFALGFWTLNEKIDDKFTNISSQINTVEKELAVIKTVLYMKNILPLELANHDESKP